MRLDVAAEYRKLPWVIAHNEVANENSHLSGRRLSDRVFAGNPAAVCPLESWLETKVMQAIAAENNLSETAFFIANGDAYDIRWFTPKAEIDLAGHPTLATAHAIFTEIEPGRRSVMVQYQTRRCPDRCRRRRRIDHGLPRDHPLPQRASTRWRKH